MAKMKYTGSVSDGGKSYDTYRDSKNREWYVNDKETKMAPDSAKKEKEASRPPMSKKWISK